MCIRDSQCIIKTQDSELPAFVVDDTDFSCSNSTIDVDLWLSYGATS